VGFQILLRDGWFKLESFGHSSLKSKIADWSILLWAPPSGLLYGYFEQLPK
jgi:hypothetical protein